MYDPTHPSSTTATAAAPVTARPRRETAVLNTVLVDPATFRTLMFMGSAQRKVFTAERMPDAAKPQKQNRDGVPEWSVKVAYEDWRGQTGLMSVTVPMHDDPAGKFTTGQPVEFDRLVMGVSDKRSSAGYSIWFSADAIAPAGVRADA